MPTTKELDAQYVSPTYARFPVEIVRGKGCLVYDETGREYIDLGTGIAVNTFGVCDDAWTAAVTAQLSQVQHTSNLFYSAPCAQLAAMLCERTGASKVFFGNSGAEANECAIKVARKYAAEKKGAEYNVILSLKNSFHGRTLATLAATGQDVFHKDFQPLPEGFVSVEANNLDAVRQAAATYKLAGILFECVQGEGGVLPLEPSFVNGLADIARENDALLVVDEVQTGNGRSGQLYAYMTYGIQPDVVTTAKGLAGGLPLGACMMFGKAADVLKSGDHGSTFGGNPVACAGALSILSRLDETLLKGVRERSAYIRETLTGKPGIAAITGLGLMLGIETTRDVATVIAECRERGVLVIKAKNKVRLLPPLNIPMELLQKAVAVIEDVARG